MAIIAAILWFLGMALLVYGTAGRDGSRFAPATTGFVFIVVAIVLFLYAFEGS